MSFDHRAVDGAYAARFLARLSEILNERDWAGELRRWPVSCPGSPTPPR